MFPITRYNNVNSRERPSQVSTPKTWKKATARANVGDYFHLPYTPIMQVVEKEKRLMDECG
jgi:hypothetical protein